MPIRLTARILGALVLALLAACASPRRGSENFPTQSELDQITPPPEAQAFVLLERKDVAVWALEGPLPEGNAQSATEPASPWDRELAVVSATRPVPLAQTRAMQCAAHELGRFYLENQGQPTESLQNYILSLCGSVVSRVHTALLQGTVADQIPTERLEAEWRVQVQPLIASFLTGSSDDQAGIWFGRAHGRAVILVVAGESRAEFSPISRVPDRKGRVRIQGRLKQNVGSVQALVNHGRFGVELCETDESVALPGFSVSCPVARNDAQAWISIGSFPEGRVLGDPVLDLLVWPTGVPGGRYQRPARPHSEPVTTADQMPAAIIRIVNEVRREARLPPVTLAREQSATARRLAPIYLLAMTGKEPPQTADKIALGMMAGWQVPGTLRHGRVTGAFAAQTRDVGDLLAEAFVDPNGRYALLDPKARRIAIGPISQAEGETTLLGALVGTYAFFDEKEDHRRDEDAVYKRLVRAGGRRGVSEISRSKELAQVAEVAGRAIRSGKWSPQEAMTEALKVAAVQRPGIQVTGLFIETTDLDQVSFGDDFFNSASLRVGLTVTHYKPADSPWGRYVVLVVAEGDKPLLQASIR